MLDKKILICSTIRNVEKDLKIFFKKIDDLTNNFKEYFIILVESNSSDNSIEKANDFLKKRNGIVITKKLDEKLYRTQRLESCRNEYLNYIRNNNYLSKFDFLIVMDADNMNNSLKLNTLINSISNIEWNAIFANQKFLYYDIWTLRIKNYLEEDCFKKIKYEANKNKNNNLKKIFYKNFTKFFFIKKNFKDRYIKVTSAFGGFGIYKLDKVLNCNYDSKEGSQCEHVGLNECLNEKYGNLFIDTKLINSLGFSKHTINGILCSIFNFISKRFLIKLHENIKN